jgi:uncharacterized Rmd1/YagE family protein
VWEARVQATIASFQHIPERLASHGRTELTEKQISKMIGKVGRAAGYSKNPCLLPKKVFIERCHVNLHSEILDSPDFLWEDDLHEPSYRRIALTLDV